MEDKKWPFDLQLFGEGAGDNNGDDQGDKGGDDQGDKGDKGGKGGDDKGKGGNTEETFPRSYVEKLRNDLKAATQAAKDAAAKLEEIDKNEKKKNGEFEKLAKDAEKKAQDAEQRLAEFQNKANQRVINAELKSAAAEYGLIDADLVRLIDMDLVKVNEEGEVEGVKTAFEALKNAKPHLFKKTDDKDDKDGDEEDDKDKDKTRRRFIPPNRGGGGGGGKSKDAKEMSDEEFNKAWGDAGRR